MKSFEIRHTLYVVALAALACGDHGIVLHASPHAPAHTPRSFEGGTTVPTDYVIKAIHIVGTHTLDKESLLASLKLQAGDRVRLPGPAIKHALQCLWDRGLVKDLMVYATLDDASGVTLTICVEENLRLWHYHWLGVGEEDQKALLAKTILPVKGSIVTEDTPKVLQRTVEGYYKQKGYANVVVVVTTAPDITHPHHVQLTIKVDLGTRSRRPNVHTIRFEGNQYACDLILRGRMHHMREKPRFTLFQHILEDAMLLETLREFASHRNLSSLRHLWDYLQDNVIVFATKFDEDKLEEDKQRIIEYYRREGFRDVAIVETTVHQLPSKEVELRMKVEEGRRYRVGSIRWVGNLMYDDTTLQEIVDIKCGDVYNPLLLQQRLLDHPNGRDVASLYVDKGYLSTQIDLVEVGIEDNRVHLEVRVQEGRGPFRINRVHIQGNRYTYDYVIRRALKTLPGDLFSRAALKRSLRELAYLGLLDPATLDVSVLPHPADDMVDLTYQVSEKFDVSADLLGSYEDCLAFGGGVSTNNAALHRFDIGGGQYLAIEYKHFSPKVSFPNKSKAHQNSIPKRDGNNVKIRFREPWLGGRIPRSFGVELDYSWGEDAASDVAATIPQESKKDGLANASSSKYSSTGGLISLGERLTWLDDYTTLRGIIGGYLHVYKHYDFGKGKQSGTLHDVFVKLCVERNSTGPTPTYPREGSSCMFRVCVTPPWSLLFQGVSAYSHKEYHQWMFDSSFFWSIQGDWVLNVRGHFGILGKYPSQERVGPFGEFVLGGDAHPTLEGVEYILFRGSEDCGKGDDATEALRRGIVYEKFVLELRHPIIPHLAHVLFFFEGGDVWKSYQEFSPFPREYALGFGFRVCHVPLVGTVGIDLGWDLHTGKRGVHFRTGKDVFG